MKKSTFIICILCICILLSGCSIGGGSDKGKHSTAEPAEKGVLNLSSYTPDTLNPLATQFSCVRDFLYLAYEGLFVVNEDFTIEGVLAKDYKISKDNKKFTINLKKGVKFHDGKSLTSKDVIASFDYVKNYSSYFSQALSDVTSYYADGDYTVIVELESPRANFLCNLDFPILPSGISSYEFSSSDFKINGTGRYKYEKTNPYESIILTKNKSWHGEGKVYIPKVCIRLLNDNQSMVYAFDSGETDIITTDRARWGEFSYTGSFKTYEITTNKYIFLGINTKSSVFSDLNLRRAFAGMIDKEKIADTVMFSHASIAHTPISSKAYFYRDGAQKEEKDENETLSIKKSDKIFVLYNTEDRVKELVAKYVVGELGDNGINAEVSAVDYETYVSKVSQGDYQLYIGKVDIKNDCDISFMFGDAANVILPEEVDSEGEVQSTVDTAVTSEICDFSDIKLNDIISNINSAKNTDTMKVAYSNLVSFYDKNVPQLPLVHMNEAILVNARIKGTPNPNLTNFYADLGGIYIE